MPLAPKVKYRVRASLQSQTDDPLTILSDPLSFEEAEGERVKLEVLGFKAELEAVAPTKKKKKVNWKLLQLKLFGDAQVEMHGDA